MGGQNVVSDIQHLRKTWPQMIWTTGPHIASEKVTKSQASILDANTMDTGTRVFHETCGDLAADPTLPCLDMGHLTSRCEWSNCTMDGGHRSRFVNRMKAQMLLNMICSKPQPSAVDSM